MPKINSGRRTPTWTLLLPLLAFLAPTIEARAVSSGIVSGTQSFGSSAPPLTSSQVLPPGHLQVHIGPNEMGQWRIEGTSEWHAGGAKISYAPGIYTIEFAKMPHYYTPPSIPATIVSKGHLILGATYTK